MVYLAVRPALGADTPALAIATAVPVVWAVVHWVRARRVDAVGLIVLAAYGCALALSLILADAATPLKLRDAGILAVVGIACLVSAGVGRPLLWIALHYLTRGQPRSAALARVVDAPRRRRDFALATIIAGILFLVASSAEVILMLNASTSTFLAIAGPLGGLTPVVAMLAMMAYLRFRSQHPRTSEPTLSNRDAG